MATAWLDHGLAIGAEAGAGFNAWGQYHPAVVQWEAPDGSVAWLRVRHRAPTGAEAGEGTLTVTCAPHPKHGPQPVIIEVRAPGLRPDAFGDDGDGKDWELPGLAAVVDADAPVTSVEQAGDDVVVVRYQPSADTVRWSLTVTGR